MGRGEEWEEKRRGVGRGEGWGGMGLIAWRQGLCVMDWVDE